MSWINAKKREFWGGGAVGPEASRGRIPESRCDDNYRTRFETMYLCVRMPSGLQKSHAATAGREG